MTAPSFRAVSHKGEVADYPPSMLPGFVEIDSLRKDVDRLNEELLDMRESRDYWADRAEKAERELARLQEQAVRIQELETALATARSDRDVYRAAVSR